jgi:hypothetical protein
VQHQERLVLFSSSQEIGLLNEWKIFKPAAPSSLENFSLMCSSSAAGDGRALEQEQNLAKAWALPVFPAAVLSVSAGHRYRMFGPEF